MPSYFTIQSLGMVEIKAFIYTSPFGPITLYLAGDICCRIELAGGAVPICPFNHPVAHWLDSYFAGKVLPPPPLASAKTLFQQHLRKALLAIPFGETRTYGELAKTLASGARAVGQALGANPMPIIVPCHRIVAKNGLGGFACGLNWKRRLLAHEKHAPWV